MRNLFLYEKGKFSAIDFGLDLTKRILQSKLKSKGFPWERAKAFDSVALFSEFVYIPKISQNLSIELDIDGNKIQSGTIKQMIYNSKL